MVDYDHRHRSQPLRSARDMADGVMWRAVQEDDSLGEVALHRERELVQQREVLWIN